MLGLKNLRLDQKGLIFSVGVIATGWGLTAMDTGIEAVKAAANSRKEASQRAESQVWETAEQAKISSELNGMNTTQYRDRVIAILTSGVAGDAGNFSRSENMEGGTERQWALKIDRKNAHAITDAQGYCNLLYVTEMEISSGGGPHGSSTSVSRNEDVALPCYKAVGQLLPPNYVYIRPRDYTSVHVSGIWTGTYKCKPPQGALDDGYRIRFDLSGEPSGEVVGIATVDYTLRDRWGDRSELPTAKYNVQGHYDRESWTLTLTPGAVLQNSAGFQPIGFKGRVDESTRENLSGSAYDPDGVCGSLGVGRWR